MVLQLKFNYNIGVLLSKYRSVIRFDNTMPLYVNFAIHVYSRFEVHI